MWVQYLGIPGRLPVMLCVSTNSLYNPRILRATIAGKFIAVLSHQE